MEAIQLVIAVGLLCDSAGLKNNQKYSMTNKPGKKIMA
uniref:Uncharacterized protein n=1 Tax=Anguilla anguilla TaxID=7936 RepID=A0A0E9PVZ5_ANGAN